KATINPRTRTDRLAFASGDALTSLNTDEFYRSRQARCYTQRVRADTSAGSFPMGQTIAEKILARKSGKSSVSPGEIVEAYPDLVMSHTATWRSVSVMNKVGATKLVDPARLAVVLDHIAPAKSEKNASDHQACRKFATKF